ncbi:MAG: imelysin family protein [Chloroflexi bacterium]|nr:imelysin family protein [Chloroflexota bacterium]
MTNRVHATRCILSLFIFIVLMATVACAQAAPPSRQQVLTSLSDDLIVPRYQEVAREMDGLNVALVNLCANPGAETLATARTAWREARAPWVRSQATWFGPVMDRRSRSLVDWSPVDPERIEATLAKRESVSANDVWEFFGSTQRGLGAIEYVIFGEDATVLASFGEPGGIRCQYLTALGDVVAEETAGVLADWTGDGSNGGYAGYFKGTASISLVEQQAIDEAARTSVFITRSIADMKLGKALGSDGGEADPSAIPGVGGNNAVSDLRNQVLGMQDVYLGAGTDGALGISALVRGVSEDADERMRGHFTATLAAIDGLREPLHTTVVSDPEPARLAHRRMQELQRALNTEVVSLLGVTVGFADTDGDGG